MSDFFQNGIITTLHNLADRPIEDLEAQLALFARDRPMTLVLPCLYSELAQPALKNILAELSKARYLSHIVIGLDRANKSQYIEALHYFSVLPQRHTVLWNDGPRLGQIQDKLRGLGAGARGVGQRV